MNTFDVTVDGQTQRIADVTAIENYNGQWVLKRDDLIVRTVQQKPGNSIAIVDDPE